MNDKTEYYLGLILSYILGIRYVNSKFKKVFKNLNKFLHSTFFIPLAKTARNIPSDTSPQKKKKIDATNRPTAIVLKILFGLAKAIFGFIIIRQEILLRLPYLPSLSLYPHCDPRF